ncbi:response regulator transcription factor [Bordetella sp. LUAb4]|uniref:response regulator transcription factor n=1 Tax=Bordetella sp. LUAb4 TaxID=2843195 RepID=UPI001E3E0BB0|nr:response regulator [Bordetella sp. LUAb4]
MNHVKPLVAVVDDDESVGRAIGRLLRSIGVTADTFKTGDLFLARLVAIPSYRPACIILDMHMPGLNGLQVQQRLLDSGIPVIFITAHDAADVRLQALAAGAAAYLRKPFDDEALLDSVKAAVDANSAT